MAQKITVIEELIDDLDGSEGHETLRFGYEGETYEIDLNKIHADDMRELMAPYVKAGRKIGGKKTAGAKSKAAPIVSNPAGVSDSTIRGERAQNKAIREWGRAQGYEVPSHGKIPVEVRTEYERAHR